MKSFSIAVNGQVYRVTELNRKSGLYELYGDGFIHTLGRSRKTSEWLYIRKSPFCPLLPLKEAARVLELFINNHIHEKAPL
jgi:hypothetical protein